MTDNDRMDRAKRIREMREGGRDDGSENPSETDDERADGGDPEKQTMADIAEEQEADTADRSDTAGADSVETIDSQKSTSETVPAAGESTGSTVEDSAGSGGATTADIGASNGGVGESDRGERAASEESSTDATSGEKADTDDGVSAPLPEMDELEAALDGTETAQPETAGPSLSESQTTPTAGGGADAAVAQTTEAAVTEETESAQEEETRVLEFTLDDEHYCLDIQYIEEIVKHENITRVPNTPAHVEGVVDLRGQITTILNPKVTIGKENDEAGELIVVFDSGAFEDQGHIGWIVDDVRQVSPIVESEVNDPPMADEHINGVIDREDDEEFVIWTSPELAFEDDE